MDGYVLLFKTFAEFIGATACICYGLMELDLYHTALGLSTATAGLVLKALIILHQKSTKHNNHAMLLTVYAVSSFYMLAVLICGLSLHRIMNRTGVMRCVANMAACVVPMVALGDRLAAEGGALGKEIAWVADAVAVAVLWWFCRGVSIKYFVVVPSIVGMVFTFIRYIMREIQKMSETDLYKK